MMKVGAGRIEYKDQPNGVTSFEGTFEKDLRDGIGYQYYSDGRVYCGQFRHGAEEGIGEFTHANKVKNEFKKVNY